MKNTIGFQELQKDSFVKYLVNKIDNILIDDCVHQAKSFVKHFFETASQRAKYLRVGGRVKDAQLVVFIGLFSK